MAVRVGFKIIDVEFNDVNGDSFSITVVKAHGDVAVAPAVQKILDDEKMRGLDTLQPYQEFATRVEETRRELLSFIVATQAEGKRLAAVGASTKGNVLCGISIAGSHRRSSSLLER